MPKKSVRQKKKRKQGLCETKYCRNKHGKASPRCSRCAMRKWRAENKLQARFSDLRNNAKKRRIAFDLTFEQFSKLASETGYSEGTGGLEKFSLTIDREDAREGYTLSNLKIITRLENGIKGYYRDREDPYIKAKI